MYNVILYVDIHGKCPIEEFILSLNSKSKKNKIIRTELRQIRMYIDVLKQFGTRVGEEYTKHIQGDLWELRPGKNRILFFMGKHNEIVLLHSFRKKTNKMPKREIERAKRERDYWIQVNGYH
ncbi:type II toxin-antitoxin system RelE/ParE family toxin [Clostridium novyi]|uniref:type II toxin-antitoxin system RelE/ParE family toxin n=1 Tax=Clostridium novyi TaxID=1542 RepID=UPI0004D7D744|nr:type II toxin-antitoxin system RelE/ParE family toxin [Clostridium novyi]KEH91612.1 hypothetical protein Z964_08880 [Clostridium novyi A str. GD211209]